MPNHAASLAIRTSGKGTYKGPDEMPSHIKMVLTRISEVIPIVNGSMTLGTWQGLFLFEHRNDPHTRKIVAMVQGD
jgi:secondary thiamine-phosphate synthase enzyme